MNILCIGAVEDRTNIDEQIAKQTIQPDNIVILVDKKPAQGINNRRKRIAENQLLLAEIVEAYKPDYVWQLEGDCILPDNCLERLIGHAICLDNIDFGYISGIQVGRHGLYCIGAWRDFRPKSFCSIDYTLKGVQRVEATGFYCLLAPVGVWLEGYSNWEDEPYGPDVVWGLSINKKKYVDMGLEIGHQIKGGVIMPSDASTCQVRFYEDDGKWIYKLIN